MAEILEDGDLYFFYRPRVEKERVASAGEVQRLLVVLRPWQGRKIRLVVVGRKHLPEVRRHDRFWGFVDAVVDRPEQLREALQGRAYETKTRGRREQPPARPAAEGSYVLARHDDHTHLAYQLELPGRLGPPQQELNIEHEASYIITVKNPEQPSRVNRSGRDRPQLPDDLRARFDGRRFTPLDPPDFLDRQGVEFVLIGAAEDASAELGLDLDREVERAARNTVFDDLRITRDERTATPLFAGEWR